MASYKVRLVSGSTGDNIVTGSIAFIKGLEYTNTVDDITFGSYNTSASAAGIKGNSNFTNISTDFILPKDDTIEGPIYSFKSKNNTGRFLVYFNL
jgi:hypothetical protein